MLIFQAGHKNMSKLLIDSLVGSPIHEQVACLFGRNKDHDYEIYQK